MSKYINIEDDATLQISDNGEPIALFHPEHKDGNRKMQKYIFKGEHNSLLDILARTIIKQDETIIKQNEKITYFKTCLNSFYGSSDKPAICIKEYKLTNGTLISLGTFVSMEKDMDRNSIIITYDSNNFKISKREFDEYFEMITNKS